VRADGPIRTLADLAGRRVSVGSFHSQANLVTERILGLAGAHDLITSELSVQDSADAMGKGTLDAFFWSGGLPTTSITKLAATGTKVRLLDLGTEVLHGMVSRYPVYNTAQVPAGTYGSDDPVTTLTVPNFLLVTDRMPDDVANALVSAMFRERAELAAVIPAARSMDVHSAIYTEPVPLHPGAEQYYRQTKI
jgi:TRAP transporter TAXI family solute receptor